MGKTITMGFLDELKVFEEQMKFNTSSGDERAYYYRMALVNYIGFEIIINKNTLFDFRNVRPSSVLHKRMIIAGGQKAFIFYKYFDHIRVAPETGRVEMIRGIFYLDADSSKLFGNLKREREEKAVEFLNKISPLMVYKIKNRSNPGAVWRKLDTLFSNSIDVIELPINYLYVEDGMKYFYDVQNMGWQQDIVKYFSSRLRM